MPLVPHPSGDYLFLPGIDPYSCGVVAAVGHEIVHVTFDTPVPHQRGFERIAGFLNEQGRPLTALCGIELRSPQPFTFAGFAEFNTAYARILQDWGVFVDGINPVARTNVAPELSPPREPALLAFSFTRPNATILGRSSFPSGNSPPPATTNVWRTAVSAVADISPAGLRRKAEFVVGLMKQRMEELNVSADAATVIDVYTVHPIDALISDPLLSRLTAGRRVGIQWHYARPPLLEIEFEMDVRGVRTELRI